MSSCTTTTLAKNLLAFYKSVEENHPEDVKDKAGFDNFTERVNHIMGWIYAVEKNAVPEAKFVEFDKTQQAEFKLILEQEFEDKKRDYFERTGIEEIEDSIDDNTKGK